MGPPEASEEELLAIRSQSWFHGSITRSLAEQRLMDALKGTFLFRESETRPGFSLSLKVPDKVKHFMITKKNSGWYLVGKPQEFDTIDELIAWFSQEENPTNSSDNTSLKYPCPSEDENPYVVMVDTVLDADALTNAMRAEQSASKKK